MIISSNFKINLGLSVISRRSDGYSEIESVLYPVISDEWCDVVEVVRSNDLNFTTTGIEIDCPVEDNLCVKAYRLMERNYGIGGAHIHLHKRLPFGAGLGAGSANCVAVLKLCNEIFKLALCNEELIGLAAQLGSDTPFFVSEVPAVIRGRGEILSPVSVDLRGYYLLLVKPDVGVSTAEAYRGVVPKTPEMFPSIAVKRNIEEWSGVLHNDFEEVVFEKLPALEIIKGEMYRAGAVYASMSGSGSTIYGLFGSRPSLSFAQHFQALIRL